MGYLWPSVILIASLVPFINTQSRYNNHCFACIHNDFEYCGNTCIEKTTPSSCSTTPITLDVGCPVSVACRPSGKNSATGVFILGKEDLNS